LFMASVLVVKDLSNTMKSVLVISILCLLYASILSQARGAWLALPFGTLLLMIVAVKHGRIKLRTIAIAFVVVLTLIILSPAKDILSSRIQKAVYEIELYQSGENARSSVGSRLAMWHVAINVWKKYPILGTGPGDYREEFIASQEQGLYADVALHTSTHNIFFQALSTTGAIGFIILSMALFILPFRLFYRQYKRKMCVASVSGMVMLTSFAVFGLTESWTLRSPAISVYLLYFVTLATVIFQETDADKSMAL
ncbi:MAG: O-antigen ligase family protein, partial [Gammaproteobacteria bacterium]|nr:O-antigen ligase family protein [Gammaproteobacteria bacterium]